VHQLGVLQNLLLEELLRDLRLNAVVFRSRGLPEPFEENFIVRAEASRG